MEKKRNNIISFSNYWTKKKSKAAATKSDSSLFFSSEDTDELFEEDGYDEQAKIYYMSNYLEAKAQPPLQEPLISQDSEQIVFPLEAKGGTKAFDENNILPFQKKAEEQQGLLPDSDKEDSSQEASQEREGSSQWFSGRRGRAFSSKKFHSKGNLIYVNFKEAQKSSQKPWALAKSQAIAFSTAAFFAFLFVFQTTDGLRSGRNLASSMKASLKSGSYVFLTDKKPTASRWISNVKKRGNPLSPAQQFKQRLKKVGGEGLSNGSSPTSL